MSLGFHGPRRAINKSVPVKQVPIKRAPVSRIPVNVSATKANIPYYDPSRVIDNIKVVKDLRASRDNRIEDARQSGTERGETQSGDGGVLGPTPSYGSDAKNIPVVKPASGNAANKLIPVALAIAAFVIFGG